jgi:hypothetical protein
MSAGGFAHMKRREFIYETLILGILLALVSTAAIPGPGSGRNLAVSTKSELIALTVENRSSGLMYLWLDGPAFYYLVLQPETTRVFTVERGEYYQKVRACGDTVESIVDITKRTRMIMPVCGSHANQAATSPYAVDLSDLIKIVKVTIENDSDTGLLAILTGPSTYVFTFDEGESTDYTIAKGDYTIQYFACGRVGYKDVYFFHGKELTLSCP